jgi:hypothetical protein
MNEEMTKERFRWRLNRFSSPSDLTYLDKALTFVPFSLSFIAALVSFSLIQLPDYLLFSFVIAGFIVMFVNIATIRMKAIDKRIAAVQILSLGFLFAAILTLLNMIRFFVTAWSAFGILPRFLRPTMDYIWVPVFLLFAVILIPLRKFVSVVIPTAGCFPPSLRNQIPGVIPSACALGFFFSVFLYIPVVEGSSFSMTYPSLTLIFGHQIPLYEPIIMMLISVVLILIGFWQWNKKWGDIIESAFK